MSQSFNPFPQFVGWFGRAVAFILAHSPQAVRHFIGDLIGILWFDVFRIRRAVALANVELAFPELSPARRRSIARWSLRHMGRSIVEYSLYPTLLHAPFDRYFRIVGRENLDAAFAAGRGVLLLGLHLGNGDLGIAAMSKLGYPISLISKSFKTQWLNDLWFGMRAKLGTQFISPEKSSFQILRALKARRGVFFVLDQFMGPPIGTLTRFFGRETGTAMGLAIMAERSGSPVLPCHTYRDEDGRHVLVFEPEIPWQDASEHGRDSDENIASMTQLYTDRIERTIRKYPEQWMWIHRRWKKFG